MHSSPATLCHSDIIATALSPARVGPAHMHSSRVRHYVTCGIITTVRHYVALLCRLFTWHHMSCHILDPEHISYSISLIEEGDYKLLIVSDLFLFFLSCFLFHFPPVVHLKGHTLKWHLNLFLKNAKVFS